MSPAYVPPHKRNAAATGSGITGGGGGGNRWSQQQQHQQSSRDKNRRSGPPPPAKLRYAFFGDSFVRLFGLIEHPALHVHGFRGASAKGLGRAGNENAETISRYIRRNHATLERCIFVFGSVDVHLSYYYKKYALGQSIDLEEIARGYVAFVNALPTTARKTIVGVYPSPLEDDVVVPSLIAYGSLPEEQRAPLTGSNDIQLAVRQARVLAFNRSLANECAKMNLDYVDMWDEILDESTMMIRDQYRDVSDHNIHIVWETTIMLWLEKWQWLKELTSPTFQAQLNRTLEEYLATKPWAERTHVTQKSTSTGT